MADIPDIDFPELVRTYSRRVYAFAYRLSGDKDIADDATQETFIKAWKNLRRFDQSRSFQAWIFAIARNATFDILRKHREVRLDDEAELMDESQPTAATVFDAGVDREVLEEIMASLSFNQRNAVYLHDIEGYTFEQISTITGKSLNTEKSHYRRAILALRKKLADGDR